MSAKKKSAKMNKFHLQQISESPQVDGAKNITKNWNNKILITERNSSAKIATSIKSAVHSIDHVNVVNIYK